MAEADELSADSADAERAVERLCDDEALRGDLEDEGYGALLQVMAQLAIQRASHFESTDALYRALRAVLVGAVEAAEHGDRDAVLGPAPALLSNAEMIELCGLLPESPGVSAEENAKAIAAALAMATSVP